MDNAADVIESWRRDWNGRPSQMVTLEQLIDCYPKWAAGIVRDLGDLDPQREVIWI